MQKLKDTLTQLENNIKTLYTSHEMSEPLQSLYTHVRIGLRIGASALLILPYQIKYLDKENKEINIFKFLIEPHIDRITNTELLNLALSKDKLFSDIFEVISESNEEIILKIKTINLICEILDIQVENNNIAVHAKIDEEVMEFNFQMIYQPEMKASAMERSKNFIELAKYNSSFETAIHSLVKRAYHREKLIFPIDIEFETLA